MATVNIEGSITCLLTARNQREGWENQMLKKLCFIRICFSPSLAWEALIDAGLASRLPAAAGVQVLCEESRDGCGSRKRTFKPDTKDLEAQGSWHLCRP